MNGGVFLEGEHEYEWRSVLGWWLENMKGGVFEGGGYEHE